MNRDEEFVPASEEAQVQMVLTAAAMTLNEAFNLVGGDRRFLVVSAPNGRSGKIYFATDIHREDVHSFLQFALEHASAGTDPVVIHPNGHD